MMHCRFAKPPPALPRKNQERPKYHFFETVVYAEMPDGEVWWCVPKEPHPRLVEFYTVKDGTFSEPVGGWKKLGPIPGGGEP